MRTNLCFLICLIFIACSSSNQLRVINNSSPVNLENHVKQLVHDQRIRNYSDLKELNRVAEYIKSTIESYGLTCNYQGYTIDSLPGDDYKNVVCKLNAGKAKTFIIGAHYDVCDDQEGADDNASGVSGMIEVARLLSKQRTKLTHNIEFVAFTLEEPPFFRTSFMGSYIHAHSIKDQISDYDGMISMEMIGYYSEDEIQDYPTGIGAFYPKHGNFIASVGNLSSKWISDNFKESMAIHNQLEVQKLAAPSFVTGIDFSDHLNYWEVGLDAIMITDTAFMRNKNYHKKTDTIETLDFNKMGYVVNGIVQMFVGQ